ncbi:MAG: PQQ-dependent sugar dehydrogenase [Oligoflexia bacterium]|nr:PQQ-dependent sugar dehydrogenase [Oligoflexia bacterium]
MALLILIFHSALAQSYQLKEEVLFKGEDVVWGFDFVSNTQIIFTERSGVFKLLDLKTKKVTQLEVPVQIYSGGQGGLLDIRLHPNFNKNNLVYFTFSKKVSDGNYTTALSRFKLKENILSQYEELFTAHAVGESVIHFGSRLAWGKNLELFMTIGERNERDKAQDLSVHNGKILRLTELGKAHPGNPFIKTKNALGEIWSYGHRNPQGIVYDGDSKILYEVEFGPRGGDEINIIDSGKNYGWPIVTAGREYWGPKIGDGKNKPGMQLPIKTWVPSISPSGMDIYKGEKLKKWKNNLFLACLSSKHLRRVEIQNEKVVLEEELLKNKNMRVRHVRSGPDGWLYISTDAGHLLKLATDY